MTAVLYAVMRGVPFDLAKSLSARDLEALIAVLVKHG